METKKDCDRKAEVEAALEAISVETWKTGQTLPKLRRAIVYSISRRMRQSKL
jgi:hypothetical protein